MKTWRLNVRSFTVLWSGASIVAKLSILYGALIALFVGVLAAVSYGGAVRVMEEESAANARLAIEQVRNSVDAIMDGIDKDTYIVFSNPEMLRALKNPAGLSGLDGRFRYAVEKLVTDVAFSNEAIDSLVIYDFKGGKVASSFMSKELSLVELGTPAKAADGRFALAAYDEERELFSLVRLVRDMDMKPVGYLRANVRANAFRRAFPTELLDTGASILVVDGERVVVFEGAELPSLALAAVAAAQGSSGSFSFRSGKVTYTASFFGSRSYSWRIVGFVPSGRIGKAARRLRDITAFASAITILAFFAVSWYIMRSFLSPIHRIADDMRRWDLSTKVNAEQYGGTDEVAFLSSRFSEMMERIRTLVDQLVDERSRLHRQELAALQAQINPHFLYNTLEIVNWMAIERGAADIASIVRALSDMMRYAIGNGTETATASEELSYVERYLSLQAFRFPDKFETCIRASEEALRCGMPKLCLQPIVENSVQHAFRGLRKKGIISVSLDIEDGDLVAVIADDGNGMDQETLDRLLTERFEGTGIGTATHKMDHAGIGVSNVDLRLKLRYGQAYGLSYVSAPGAGTTCTLRIPANGGNA